MLIAALRETAAGSWGLFGHNSDKFARKLWDPKVTELTDLGEAIDAMRATLGLEPYALFAEFLASRGPVASNAPGEPKQARSWLMKLDADQ